MNVSVGRLMSYVGHDVDLVKEKVLIRFHIVSEEEYTKEREIARVIGGDVVYDIHDAIKGFILLRDIKKVMIIEGNA